MTQLLMPPLTLLLSRVQIVAVLKPMLKATIGDMI